MGSVEYGLVENWLWKTRKSRSPILAALEDLRSKTFACRLWVIESPEGPTNYNENMLQKIYTLLVWSATVCLVKSSYTERLSSGYRLRVARDNAFPDLRLTSAPGFKYLQCRERKLTDWKIRTLNRCRGKKPAQITEKTSVVASISRAFSTLYAP